MDRPYHLQILVVGACLYLRADMGIPWYLGAEPDGTNASARAHKLARLLDCQVTTSRNHPRASGQFFDLVDRP